VNSVYVFVYRLYIAIKTSVLDRTLLRWPGARRAFSAAKDFGRRIFPSRTVWIQVQSGPAQGMWMHLRIPEEAGFWRGEHEPDVMAALSAMVKPGTVVYDAGAHLGSITLAVARLVGATGRVVAFEADPDNAARLRENVARNHLEPIVQIVPSAVWSRSDSQGVAFRRGRAEASQGGVEADGQRPVLADGETIQVAATTFDDFVVASKLPPNLVKIDVEGGECEALQGGESLFTVHRPWLIVEVHNQQAYEWLGGWLEKFHYAPEWKIPKENFPRYLIALPAESGVAKGAH
jgi:FkbM family methyltransferase